MPGRWLIGVTLDFSASHCLRNYGGKCEALHGHNFSVTVEVEGREPDPATGLVLDFKILKTQTKAVLETLDHAHLNDTPPFRDVNPSSEHIARHVFGLLAQRLSPYPVRLKRVQVAEKPGQWAVYMEDEA